MKNILTYLIYGVLAAMLCGCSGDGGFEITLEIAGQGNRGIGMTIVRPSGVSETELHPRDGKVKARGSSAEPALVEFFDLGGGMPIVSLLARDGDRITVKADPRQGYKALVVEGPDEDVRYAAWLAAHHSLLSDGPAAQVNDSIRSYVGAHLNDFVSTMLMVTCYRASDNPARADSLFSHLHPDVRPSALASTFSAALASQVSASTREPLRAFTATVGRDTIVRFAPSGQSYALLVFQSGHKPDSTVRRLRALRRDAPERVEILELSFSRDSATWRNEIHGDSARWKQAWLPAGPAAQPVRKLNVPATPFYIIIDSIGYQQYRGRSLATADSVVRARMNIKSASNEKPDETKAPEATPAAPATPVPQSPARPGMMKIKPVQ